VLKKKKEELIYLAKNKSKEKKQIKTKHVKQPRKHTLSLAMVLLKTTACDQKAITLSDRRSFLAA
jgi:hypothetical protein